LFCRIAWLKAPNRSREDTIAEPGFGRPAAAARSASRTPVQVCVVDQPSTQAIGNSTVWRGIACSAARSSITASEPPSRRRRHPVPVTAGSMPAAMAVRLI
jgi:hypothetical protein